MQDVGDIDFGSADDANVPVDVWLKEESDNIDVRDAGGWRLSAANYCPRKDNVYEGAYEVWGTREELVEVIKTKILPLYQTATDILQMMCQGTADHLYYWSKPNES